MTNINFVVYNQNLVKVNYEYAIFLVLWECMYQCCGLHMVLKGVTLHVPEGTVADAVRGPFGIASCEVIENRYCPERNWA
jgi:hypothetical protein